MTLGRLAAAKRVGRGLYGYKPPESGAVAAAVR